MAPVVLQMDVHCYGCGKKIRKALEKIPGVEGVSSSFETNRVVVMGTANVEELRNRLQDKMRKPVTILSDGVDEPPARRAPSRRAPSPPPPTPAPPASPPLYRPPTSPPNYPPPPRPQNYYDHIYPYGPNDSLATFSDENPNACSIQ